jgi:hypothetical protein
MNTGASTPLVSDETRKENSYVYHYVTGSGSLQDCYVCQTDKGTEYTGIRTRRDIPVDIRQVIIIILPNNEKEEKMMVKDGVRWDYRIEYICTDCLYHAKNCGVNVLDARNEWKPEGFFLRQVPTK